MKKLFLIILSQFLIFNTFSQVPLNTATLGLTMQCSGGTSNRTGVSFNPIQNIYYSVNAGSPSYPIETFNDSGVFLATTTSGFDYRGSWWNPNTNKLEGNGFNTLGIWIQDLNASSYPLSTGTSSISGVNGPNSQCSANYDWIDDEILYYYRDTIYRYSRSNHILIGKAKVSGIPTSTNNINFNSVAYTGVPGMEAGIYDYVNKTFLFINKTTGNFQALCQLPISAPAANSFKIGFANGYLWLFDGTLRQWKGYGTVSGFGSGSNCNTISSIMITTCDSIISPSGNFTFTVSGNYKDTITNAAGCDSIISINLTINNSSSSTDVQVACDSYTWTNGVTYTTSNSVALDTFTNVAGCDSIVTLNLTINNTSTFAITDTINCIGYTMASGKLATSSGIINDTIPNATGCDSIITYTLIPAVLNINHSINNFCDSNEITITGDGAFSWYKNSTDTVPFYVGNNLTHDTNATYYVQANCNITSVPDIPIHSRTYTGNTRGFYFVAKSDFVISRLRVPDDGSTANQTIEVIKLVNIPPAYSSFTNAFTSLGFYDGIVGNNWATANIQVNTGDIIGVLGHRGGANSYSNGPGYFIVNGDTMNLTRMGFQRVLSSGVRAQDIWQEASGPISRVQMEIGSPSNDTSIQSPLITIVSNISRNTTRSIDTQVACESYTWINGITYTSNNMTAEDTLINAAGCDSIITLNLTINTSTSSTDIQNHCDSYTWTNGITYTTSNNIALDTFVNAKGCDSIVTLNLTIRQSTYSVDVQDHCDTYTWTNGVTYTASNNLAKDTFTNAAGCDSIVTLDLTIRNSTSAIDIQTHCESYTWTNGVTYTTSNNTALDTFVNSAGCDSIVTLNLTINYTTRNSLSTTVCDSYTGLSGKVWTSSGIYEDTVLNSLGCDSITTYSLIINNSSFDTIVTTACVSYTGRGGQVWTTSGTYSDITTNSFRCTRTTVYYLTINPTTFNTITAAVCGGYKGASGQLWTTSGTYIDTVPNAKGCDSITTYNLTINNASSSVDIQVACDSYTWINGNTYTSSTNTATHVITNSAGCDSVITLNLTINYNSIVNRTIRQCDGYTVPETGNVYSVSGLYKDSVVNSSGCYDYINTNLTINTVNAGTISLTSSGLVIPSTGDFYRWLDCDDNFVPLTTGDSSQTFIPTSNGNYACMVFTFEGCIDTSACFSFNSVGLDSKTRTIDWILFPNPTRDFVTLRVNGTHEVGSIKIYNATGKLVREDIIGKDQSEIQIDVQNLASGMYTVMLQSELVYATKKLIIN